MARIAVAFAVALPAGAQFYKQTNLVSDVPALAQFLDPHLINSWGVSHSAGSPFWVSDAGASVSTLYTVDPVTGIVSQPSLTSVLVPLPTGQVHNGVATDFLLGSAPAIFIFASLNGNVYAWNTDGSAVPAATGAAPAVYTGIALGTFSGTQHLYVANPAGNRIDVYDNTFANANGSFAGKWVDPNLPAGLVPFNIANLKGNLFVSYAPMNPAAVGFGVIDVFDTSGTFLNRFATGSATVPLYNPWGMVVAPADFGQFSNDILVGDFNLGNGAASPPSGGPGYILAFDASGGFLGTLQGTDSTPLKIDGLWQLIFGNGVSGGNSSTLYFAAGIQNQSHGLFGSLTACGGPAITGASANPSVLWPPNNKMVPVAIDYSVADNCDAAAPSCSLSVSVADSGGGEDDLAGSSVVLDAHHVELRASRNGGGSGRIYSVAISCKDKLPLSSSSTVTVMVPHDQGN